MNRRTALALGASAVLAARAPAGAQQPVKMVLGAVPEESVTPALWAQQSGMFLRAGLDVTVESQSSGTAIAAGVAGGSYAAGKSSLGAIISAHVHGLPFVVVAGGSRYDSKNSYSSLAVKADSPFKTGADLNGKLIASPALNDVTTIATKAWIDQHGGDSSTVKVLEFPFAAIPDALAAGRVDAGFIADPILQQAIDAGKVRVLAHAFDAIALQFMITSWFMTADYAEKNHATVVKFNRVMADAAAYVEAHPADAVSLLSKFGGVDPAVILKSHRLTYAALDPRLIQPVIDTDAKYKVIPATFDAKDLIAPGLH
jgi:NitT/TauT family transport system substrate-binding protein